MAMAPLRTTFADHKATYEAALQSLFVGRPEDAEADVSRIFAPTLTVQADKTTFDFASWVHHVRWLREILPPNRVTLVVTQFLRDGNQLAERHSSETLDADGMVLVRAETFMFVRLAADGRIDEVVETVKRKPTDGYDSDNENVDDNGARLGLGL